MLLAMTRKRLALAITGAALATGAACAAGCQSADSEPASGEYCSQKEPVRCATISFPAKRGTAAPGTMQINGKRYEVSWMDGEGAHRRYLASPPSGTVALEMTAGGPRTMVVKWRDDQREETYVLK
jgi:hypothetical protein